MAGVTTSRTRASAWLRCGPVRTSMPCSTRACLIRYRATRCWGVCRSASRRYLDSAAADDRVRRNVALQPVDRQLAVLLRRMEVRLEVGKPRLEAVAHEAMLAEEEDCSALPRAPAQQLAVVPEVACRLAQHVGREVPGHQAHQPAPPQLAAAHRAVEVERHAAVLRFLARVPVPQRLQPR